MGNKPGSQKAKDFKNKLSSSNHHGQSSQRNHAQPDAPSPFPTPSRYCDDDTYQISLKGISSVVPTSPGTSARLSSNGAGQGGECELRPSSRSSLHDQHACNSELTKVSSNEGTTYRDSGGFFANANNVQVSHATMAEHIHGDIHQHYHDANLLKEMKAAHVTIEAEFDSSDREYAPRCHPGTRTRFLDELKDRIHSATRIIWLFGPAGTGKSAIMQTLAETLAPTADCLSFFFSRPNRRNDPKKVFPTLAYRLAIVNPGYRLYLEENLARDPDFLAKTLDEQFRRLFVDPIIIKRIDTFIPCVVFLDGLDEADGSSAQCRILELIQGFVEHDQNSSIPISWVIASRPEPHIRTSFSEIEETVPDDLWKLEIPIDSDEAARDVETYIRAAFLRIRKIFSDVVPAHWPPEADLLKVTTTSNGLFVFGSTCMGYIGDQNPVQRLKHIVGLINHYRGQSQNTRPNLRRNPFEILDLLYGTILDSIPDDTLPTTRAILGFHLLSEEVIGIPPFAIACQILGCDKSDAYAALRGLHSVLDCPPQENSDRPLKFLHASFSDFLKDKSRSGKHWIDVAVELQTVWRCYVRVFRWFVEEELPKLKPLNEGQCIKYTLDNALLDNHCYHNWLGTLITHCHILPCNCGVSYHLVLDADELIGVFEEFSRFLICPETRYWLTPRQVTDWLFGTVKHAPTALLERVYQQTMTLDKFTESDFDCIFRGLRSGRSATWSTSLFGKVNPIDLLDDAQWEDFKHTCEPVTAEWIDDDLLLRDDWRLLHDLMCLDKEKQTKYAAMIFGIRETGLWAVVSGKFRNSVRDFNYLAFPYIESDNN